MDSFSSNEKSRWSLQPEALAELQNALARKESEASVYYSIENMDSTNEKPASSELQHLNLSVLNGSIEKKESRCDLKEEKIDIPENVMQEISDENKSGAACDGSGDALAVPRSEPGESSSILSIESAVLFEDGKRRIDFILVHSSAAADTSEEHSTARAIFEENLRYEGLQLEYAYQEEMELVFVKIHAPWDVLSRYGEVLKFKMPMKESLYKSLDLSKPNCVPDFDFSKYYQRNLFSRTTGSVHSVSDIYADDVTYGCKDTGFSTVYTKDKEYLFNIPSRKEEFFSPAQRSRIVQFILKRKSFTNDTSDVFGFGIKKLLADNIYTAAYPLHEGDLDDRSPSNPRWFLLNNWASFSCIFTPQPLNQIRHYFGVKIGLYFAWLGFYTYMLIPASIMGFLCFMYGALRLKYNVPSNEICKSKLLMCPRCDDECHYWYLNESCTAAKVTYLVDNAATVIYALLMSLWGAVFLEMWKRYSAEITHQWDLTGFDTSEEHPRPEYLARLSKERKKKINYVTRMYEPHVPFWKKRLPYSVMSTSIVLLLITIALAAVAGVILYRISVNAALLLLEDKRITTFASIITSTTAALLNLICIMIFNQFYTKVATYLTELELHRTQTEFDDSLTLKMFLLQFVNYYSSIFYIAFFKGKIIGHPGNYNLFFGHRQEECGTGGCLMELAIQLSIIMVGKQALNNILELAVPWLSWLYQWWQMKKKRKQSSAKSHITTRWEEDYVLADWGPTHLFFEYLEMILQFGFLTIFVAAFPLAPFFALLNNILEIRLDARKLVTTYKRPVGVRVKNIGIWFRILDSIGKLAVLSNGVIIAFTSDTIPRLVYRISVSQDFSLTGYVNHSLSYFNTSDFPPYVKPLPLKVTDGKHVDSSICRYRDYREPPWSENKYEYTEDYWHLLAVRFAFVLVFENVILMITTLVRWLIPDVPKKLRERIRHENFITNEIMIAQELQRAKGLAPSKDNLLHPNDAVQRNSAIHCQKAPCEKEDAV